MHPKPRCGGVFRVCSQLSRCCTRQRDSWLRPSPDGKGISNALARVIRERVYFAGELAKADREVAAASTALKAAKAARRKIASKVAKLDAEIEESKLDRTEIRAHLNSRKKGSSDSCVEPFTISTNQSTNNDTICSATIGACIGWRRLWLTKFCLKRLRVFQS